MVSDESTLKATEAAMNARIEGHAIDLPAAYAVSSLYRAANAVRNHLTNTVLREHDLTWTGFVVLWVVWIWRSMEARKVAESAAISKATLSGVIKTLTTRGWLARVPSKADRRLVLLELTASGEELMNELYPKFNAAESAAVAGLSAGQVDELTATLRTIVEDVSQPAESAAPD